MVSSSNNNEIDAHAYPTLLDAFQAGVSLGRVVRISRPVTSDPIEILTLTEANTLIVKGAGLLSPITFTDSTTKIAAIRLEGTAITGALTENFATFFSGSGWQVSARNPSARLVADITPNTFLASVTDSRDWAVGYEFAVRAQRLCEGQNRAYQTRGETNRVKSITAAPTVENPNGGIIEVEYPFADGYESAVLFTGTVVSATVSSIVLSAGASTLDAAQVRGCRVLVGSQFRYCKSFDPATQTLTFETSGPNPSPSWSPVPSNGDAITVDPRAACFAARMPTVEIDNLDIEPPASFGGSSTLVEGIRLVHCFDSRLRRVGSAGAWPTSQKRINSCIGSLISEDLARKGNAVGRHSLTVNTSRNTTWENPVCYNFWQGGDVGGDYESHGEIVRNGKFIGGYATENGAWGDEGEVGNVGLTTHGPARDILYDGCVIDVAFRQIYHRGTQITYRDCDFNGSFAQYAIFLNGGRSVTIERCRLNGRDQSFVFPKNAATLDTSYELIRINADNWWGDLVIDGLSGSGLRSNVIYVNAGAGTLRGRINVRNIDLSVRSASDVYLLTGSGSFKAEGATFQVAPDDVRVTGGGKFLGIDTTKFLLGARSWYFRHNDAFVFYVKDGDILSMPFQTFSTRVKVEMVNLNGAGPDANGKLTISSGTFKDWGVGSGVTVATATAPPYDGSTSATGVLIFGADGSKFWLKNGLGSDYLGQVRLGR